MKPSKTDESYWRTRLTQTETKKWVMVVKFKNDRERFYIQADNQKKACQQAGTIYAHLQLVGMIKTREKFKPGYTPPAPKISNPTIGEYIAAVGPHLTVTDTSKRSYFETLRMIASEIAGLSTNESRAGRDNPIRAAWLLRVNRLRLSILTPAAILSWKRLRLDAAQNPVELAAKKRSVNSYLGHVKHGLFTDELAEAVADKMTLALPLPFSKTKLEQINRTRYVSRVNAMNLFREAREELPVEQLKLVVLGLCAGLRKGEASTLTWGQVDLNARVIRVETTKWFKPKTAGSTRAVHLSEDICKLFYSWRVDVTDEDFVVNSPRQAREAVGYYFDRCKPVMRGVLTWLRGKGIISSKPYHELRKEFGSMMMKRYPGNAATLALGHASPKVTFDSYSTDCGATPLSFAE